MRILAFIVLAVLGAGPASALGEYIYLDQGVAIQFPVKAEAMQSTYDSIFAKRLPAMVYSAEDRSRPLQADRGRSDRPPRHGSNFLNEAGYGLMREGEILFTDFPRVYQDAKSIYGVTLVVDRMDGSRVAQLALLPQRQASILPRPWCCRRAATRT